MRRAPRPLPLLLALPWLPGCTAEPNGPALALVTVSDLPAEAGAPEGALWPFLASAARARLGRASATPTRPPATSASSTGPSTRPATA